MNLDRRTIDDTEWALICLAIEVLEQGDGTDNCDAAYQIARTLRLYRDRKPAPRKLAKSVINPGGGVGISKPEPMTYADAKAMKPPISPSIKTETGLTEDNAIPKFLDRRGGAA